jgi:hypothetical protein
MMNENRIVAALLVAACAVSCTSLFSNSAVHASSQASENVVRATRIELIDAAGVVRGVLGPDPRGTNGMFGLYLLDPAGNPNVSLAAANTTKDRGFGLLALDNSATAERVSLMPAMEAGLKVQDSDGITRAQITLRSVDSDQAPAILLRDGAGCDRVELSQSDGCGGTLSSAQLLLASECNEKMKWLLKPSVGLLASSDRPSQLIFYEAGGNVLQLQGNR